MSKIKKRVFHLDLDFNQMCLLRNALLEYSILLNEDYLSSLIDDCSFLLDKASQVDDLYVLILNVLDNKKL